MTAGDTPAPRGEILDRNGKLLVGNVNEPVIDVDRLIAAQNPAMVARLAALLGMTILQLNGAIDNAQYSPYTSRRALSAVDFPCRRPSPYLLTTSVAAAMQAVPIAPKKSR